MDSPKSLNPDTVLRRAADIKLEIDSSNEVQVTLDDLNGTFVVGGRHTLAVLDALHQPSGFGSLLEKLRPRVSGAQDWMELTNTVVQLYRVGVLQDAAV